MPKAQPYSGQRKQKATTLSAACNYDWL